MSIWKELTKRKVFRVAAAFVVIAWVLIQAAMALEDILELPEWFDKVTLALLLLGFPVALVLSWSYDLRPDNSNTESRPVTKRAVITTTLGVIVFAGATAFFYASQSPSPNEHVTEVVPAIAVLPFADLSPGSDQQWLADGIAEEILNVLAKTDGLKVTSRALSFRYRDDNVHVGEAAAEMGVSTLLSGSVRSQGDTLRITAQLINANDGFHLWSETFDRDQEDIFAVQDEISVNIATALFGELGIRALPENRFDATQNVEAYNAYLRGISELNGVDPSRFEAAATDFRIAIEQDEEYVDAWAALSRSENIIRAMAGSPPTVNPALTRALQLDSNNALAVAELARLNAAKLQWPETEQLFLRSIALDPENANSRLSFGIFLRRTGRVDRALFEFLSAQDLGSQDINLGSLIVNTYAYLGRFSDARAAYERELAQVGQAAMRGNEAYFVSLLADEMEAEAREFASRDLPGTIAPLRIRFFVGRLDGDPDAASDLIEDTLDRIRVAGFVRQSDVENMLLAGANDLARKYTKEIISRYWDPPSRLYLYVDDEIDDRYLPFRPNLLIIADEYPDVLEAFRSIGVDLVSRAREKGYID